MQYIRFRAWLLFAALAVGLVLLFRWAATRDGIYKSEHPITDEAIVEYYPKLYKHLYNRSAEELKPFLTHPNKDIRAQAWRGLASTPVDSVDAYIALAQEQNTEEAWFAISNHRLNERQLRNIESHWNDGGALRTGIAQVLGRQGDRKSLGFLLSKLDAGISVKGEYALALSRLLLRYQVNAEKQIKIIRRAFNIGDDQLKWTYLYGWYRGAKTPLTAAAKDTLMSRWKIQGIGFSQRVDQAVNKLLPKRTTYNITNVYNSKQKLEHNVQLSLELAKSLGNLSLTSQNSLAAKILLMHTNPHVRHVALQNIESKLSKDGRLYDYISTQMIADSARSTAVWLQAVEALVGVDSTVAAENDRQINMLVDKNPYLWSQALDIYEAVLPPEEYLDKVDAVINHRDTLASMYGLQSLASFWDKLPEPKRNEEIVNRIRKLTFAGLDMQDRGIAYVVRPLLENEELFTNNDFGQINSKLSAFQLPGDIEVFQQFGELYKERFEDQAQSTIDSLASLGYPPLNRSLAEAGWEVSVTAQPPDFRMPDWERLWELGSDPHWVLRTEKGNITIEMDPLRAPATVSAIDSLSRAGAYEGVPFHRVVPNFVIQGGDIERQDGFGGPDFVLPTEPSELGFTSGAAGIASAGTDTEGSQYFMMLQWAPHLNGNYTRFGKVVEGKDVIESIEIGDKVLSTDWY